MAKITLTDGTIIEGTAEELIEIQQATGTAEYSEETSTEALGLKVGDYARITGAGDRPPYNTHEFPIGEIVEVIEVEDEEYGDRFLARGGDGEIWWVLNEYAVKATEGEIERVFGGRSEETQANTQSVRVRDYVVFDGNHLDITAGKPYKVEVVDYSDDTFTIIDDAGDEQWFGGELDNASYKLYRPIEGAPQVGDKILVVNPIMPSGYTAGDVLTVREHSPETYIRSEIVRTEECGSSKILRKEFVIIERASEEKAVEPTTEIEEGDIVRNRGKLYVVKEIGVASSSGDFEGVELDGEGEDLWRFPHNIELVAKKADRRDLSRKDLAK